MRLVFARSVAMPAFQKQLTKQALTKTSGNLVMKQCLLHRHQPHEEELGPGRSKVIPAVMVLCQRHDFRVAPVPVRLKAPARAAS